MLGGIEGVTPASWNLSNGCDAATYAILLFYQGCSESMSAPTCSFELYGISIRFNARRVCETQPSEEQNRARSTRDRTFFYPFLHPPPTPPPPSPPRRQQPTHSFGLHQYSRRRSLIIIIMNSTLVNTETAAPKPRREFLGPLKSLVRSISGNNLAAKNKKLKHTTAMPAPAPAPAPAPQRPRPEKLVKGRRRASSFWSKKVRSAVATTMNGR